MQTINDLYANSHFLLKFQTVVIFKTSMTECVLFYSLMYYDFKRIVPHPNAQAFCRTEVKMSCLYLSTYLCFFCLQHFCSYVCRAGGKSHKYHDSNVLDPFAG